MTTTDTAITAAPIAGEPMMTADEARTTIGTIRTYLDDAGALLLDLQEREGWRALGYPSWRACIQAELDVSVSRAYQLLDAAKVDRVLSTIVESPVPIPEAHARLLMPVLRHAGLEMAADVYTEALGTRRPRDLTAKILAETIGRYQEAGVLSLPRREPAQPVTDVAPLTAGATRYGVIVVDCPWEYRNRGVNGAAARHYPTMGTDELRRLPLADLAAPDCVLLTWATWSMLPDALALLGPWGFEYVSGFPWIKVQGEPARSPNGESVYRPTYGTGFWVRGCSELILIARRGSPPRPSGDFVGLISERFEHSRKPDNIYELAESLPGPYLELFARRDRPGWECRGNEIPATPALLAAGGAA